MSNGPEKFEHILEGLRIILEIGISAEECRAV